MNHNSGSVFEWVLTKDIPNLLVEIDYESLFLCTSYIRRFSLKTIFVWKLILKKVWIIMIIYIRKFYIYNNHNFHVLFLQINESKKKNNMATSDSWAQDVITCDLCEIRHNSSVTVVRPVYAIHAWRDIGKTSRPCHMTSCRS